MDRSQYCSIRRAPDERLRVSFPLNCLRTSLPYSARLAILCIDPRRYSRVQHFEWQGPSVQNLVMKRANIVLAAEFLLRALAQLQNLKLPQFVTQRLCRPCD